MGILFHNRLPGLAYYPGQFPALDNLGDKDIPNWAKSSEASHGEGRKFLWKEQIVSEFDLCILSAVRKCCLITM